MTKASKSKRSPDKSEQPPHRVRLPGFVTRRGDRAWRRDQARDLAISGSSPAGAANAGRPHSTAGLSSLAGRR